VELAQLFVVWVDKLAVWALPTLPLATANPGCRS